MKHFIIAFAEEDEKFVDVPQADEFLDIVTEVTKDLNLKSVLMNLTSDGFGVFLTVEAESIEDLETVKSLIHSSFDFEVMVTIGEIFPLTHQIAIVETEGIHPDTGGWASQMLSTVGTQSKYGTDEEINEVVSCDESLAKAVEISIAKTRHIVGTSRSDSLSGLLGSLL